MATIAQTASIAPNGQAPTRNPYTEASTHAPANARTNHELRLSKAYVTSMALTATTPNQVSGLIRGAAAI